MNSLSRFSRYAFSAIIGVLVLGSLTSYASAYLLYREAWPAADGRVYACAITDVTPDQFGMQHTAGASIQLIKPNGYSTSATNWAQNVIRVDVSLAFDESDGGEWTLTSHHDGICPVMGHFINNILISSPWILTLSLSTTYFTDPIPYGGDACRYTQTACTPGTTPTCGGGWGIGSIHPPCPGYAVVDFLVVTYYYIGGSHDICILSVPYPADGPGDCN